MPPANASTLQRLPQPRSWSTFWGGRSAHSRAPPPPWPTLVRRWVEGGPPRGWPGSLRRCCGSARAPARAGVLAAALPDASAAAPWLLPSTLCHHTVLERLQAMVNLLEQYYHPSNGGR